MDATAPTPLAWPAPLSWLRDFLREELAPYPGRLMLVARMVISATIVMLITETFRLPYGAYGAIYALTLSREDTQATLAAVKTVAVQFVLAAAYVLVGAMLFSDDQNLRLLWVIVTFFVMFFFLSTASNYTAAVRFGYLVVITIPLWDQHATAEYRVETTLWAVWTITLASAITAAVELVFAALQPGTDLLRSLAERLDAVEEVLRSAGQGQAAEEKAAERVSRLALLGTSRLRRLLQRSAPSLTYAEQMGATVALVGRLVDIAAVLKTLDVRFSESESKAVHTLADNIAKIRGDLMSGQPPHLDATAGVSALPHSVPLLQEAERTVSMISETFTGALTPGVFAPQPSRPTPTNPFVPDAFTNPDHIKFALRGCLAASLCYIIYNLLDWPGISTAITTCLLTALTTIGGSRQKQVLRFAGAFVGGLAGLAMQMWAYPGMDSIFGFTVLFLILTVASAWFITSGPRLSYFGVQFVIVTYLIAVADFKIQTSLTPARDRVAGITLGLFMMWLAFDQLWGAPAAVQMKKTFISVFRSVAQLAREPLSSDLKVAIERSYALRDTINRNYNQVRSLGDGVLLEFGPSRQQDLEFRSRIIRLQSQLRMIFLTAVTLLKYRLRLPGFELPEQVRAAEQEFHERLAQILEAMADRLEGQERRSLAAFENSSAHLEQVVRTFDSANLQEIGSANINTFLLLCRRITGLVVSLDQQI